MQTWDFGGWLGLGAHRAVSASSKSLRLLDIPAIEHIPRQEFAYATE
jgi:hypothetical protein